MFDNNNQSNQINVNTTLITWYSDTSMFTIGAWNEKISLKFTPCAGKDANGLNVYNREQTLSTALTLDKATVLFEKINEEIIPLLVEGNTDEKSVSLQLGGKESVNVLTVAREKNADGDMQLSITFLKGVNPDGKASTSTQIITYVFKDDEYMIDYDNTTGSGTTGKLSGQFKAFVDILKYHVFILPMSAHSSRYSKAVIDKIGKKFNNGTNASLPTDSFSGGFSAMDELPFN